VKRLHTFGGCAGALKFTEDAIYYVTDYKKDAREWLLARDVQSVWPADRYQLEIYIFNKNRREFSCSYSTKFILKIGTSGGKMETFLARQQERERVVPRFVERELRSFLECGILANGFLRLHCDDCGKDRLVPFSCKGRGFCASCCGRRMAGTAAHLVDRVLPEVPIRQWVLSLPYTLRFRLAYDANLVSAVLHIFVNAVFDSTPMEPLCLTTIVGLNREILGAPIVQNS
jgi:hypothetical protein